MDLSSFLFVCILIWLFGFDTPQLFSFTVGKMVVDIVKQELFMLKYNVDSEFTAC